MLPHPHSLTLPLKEGIRDLRTAIRLEATSGALSSRLIGTSEPAQRLAQVADGFLTRAERMAVRVRPRAAADTDRALDRLAASLAPGAALAESADLYAVCRAVLGEEGPSDVVVSELRLAARASGGGTSEGDEVLRAARAADRLAAVGAARPCLTMALGPVDLEAGAAVNGRMALSVWLAVLVRRESGAPCNVAILAASRAVEAEGGEWRAMLRASRVADLASAWRETIPYLP